MGAKIFFLKDGLEKLAFATWEKWVRSVRACAIAPLAHQRCRTFRWEYARHRHVPGGARRRSRSKGSTAPSILLQYPTPRFRRTSISRIVLHKHLSSAILTSRYSGRRTSYGPQGAHNREVVPLPFASPSGSNI